MANTAYDSSVGSFSYAAEASFADTNLDTIAATLQLRDDQIDFSGLELDLIDPGGVHPRKNVSDNYRLPAYGVGTFTTRFDLAGHGSTTAGSLSITPLGTLLGHVFGNSVWSQVGGALTTGTNDTDTITSTNTTLLEGGLLRVGALGDGRAEGQGTVALDATSSYELGAALPGSPTTADSAYVCGMVYPGSATATTDILTSNSSAANNTLRIQLSTKGNLTYICRGCAATAVRLVGMNPGEIPQIEITWGTVAWNPVVAAADASITVQTPVPNAAGSLFINSVTNAGTVTTTRATLAPMEIEINLGHSVVPRLGPGGENARQSVVGWHRVSEPTTVAFTVEAEAETASPSYWLTSNPTTARHALLTQNCTDGSAILFYFPRLIQMRNPTMGDWQGIRSARYEFRAATGVTGGSFATTNELTLSAWRMGLG